MGTKHDERGHGGVVSESALSIHGRIEAQARHRRHRGQIFILDLVDFLSSSVRHEAIANPWGQVGQLSTSHNMRDQSTRRERKVQLIP